MTVNLYCDIPGLSTLIATLSWKQQLLIGRRSATKISILAKPHTYTVYILDSVESYISVKA